MGKFTVYEAKAFLQEAQRRIDERLKNEENVTQCVTQSVQEVKNTMCTQRVFTKKEANCVQDVFIDKRDYGMLLRQLEQWGTAYPKAICRIYGVQTVLRAVEYTKATPNVKNKGGYCLYMCRQLQKKLA